MNDKTKADLLENAPAIIAFHDRDHNVLWANAAYREATGLSLEETEGKKCYAVWRLAKTCRNCPVTTAVETGEPAEAELTPSNQDHWPDTQGSWLTKAVPIRDQGGSIIGAVEVTYNIADRKRAEEEVHRLNEELEERVRQRAADLEATSQQLHAANQELEASNQQLRASERDLRHSEKLFRSIFEQASVGMAMVALDGTLTRVNDAFCEIVGYSRDELTGMTFQEITHPDDLEKSLHYVEQMLGGEMRRYFMEGRYLRKDREVAWAHVSVGVMRDAHGAPAYFSAVVEDIGELKRSEVALRESEERLRLALSAADMGAWRWVPATNSDTRDGSFNRILGLEPVTSTQPVGDFLGHVHAEDRAAVAEAIELARRERTTYVAEFRITRPDGEVRWLRDRGMGFYDQNGEMIYMTGAVVDISELREATDALREAEARYRAILEGAAEGILVADVETRRFTYANPSICRMLGYTAEELQRLGVSDIHPKDELPHVLSEFEAQARGEQALAAGLPCLRKDGSVFHADITTAPAVIDGRSCNVGFFADVTERERAEEALRRSESHYRTVFDNTGAATVILEGDATISLANEQFAEICGYSRDEVEGKRKWTEFVVPEDLERMQGYHEARRREPGFAPASYEFRFRDREGNVKQVLASVAMIPGTDRSVASLVDITERTQLEEQLLQAQKMESVGRLAGGVAHDFNNLLTGIKGCAGFALEVVDAGSQAHEDLTEVLTLADRAANLTRQLLAFSRSQPLEPVVLDLNALIAEQVKMLTRLLEEDIELRFSPASNLGNVRADLGQIEQVIMNLAVNARDAMPQGGRLTIETDNVELGEDYARSHAEVTRGPYVMVAVSDTGCGMDETTRAQIFEPFFTTKGTGKGTGLGLSTVYGIVKQHGGNIWVYSEPGRGATFKIYLPRVSDEVEERRPPSEFVLGGGEAILLVEDDESVREVCRRHLDALGYTVLSASGGREAEDIAQGHEGRIDLLLTDVVMPDRNGRELYESLAAEQVGLKVLYMSGYTDNAILHHGVLEEGAVFLQKPFERKNLAAKVRQALER